MKKSLFIIFYICTLSSYSQKIIIGDKFTITFENLDTYKFNIEKTNTNIKTIEDRDIQNVDLGIPKENEIIGRFVHVNSAGNIVTALLLKNGTGRPIKYFLDVKPDKQKLKQSEGNCETADFSFKIFPFEISYIKFNTFKKFIPLYLPPIVNIDSTCIKSTNTEKEFSDDFFKNQFEMIFNRVQDSSKVYLKPLADLEEQNKRVNSSLNHYWGVSKDLYQPEMNESEFGNPITYSHVECPYFTFKTNYFYHKSDSALKLTSFNWEPFQSHIYQLDKTNNKKLDTLIIEKYDLIKNAIIKVAGKPLIIEQDPQTGIYDTMWETESGVFIYLFRFLTYNEIRLYMYK